MKPILEIQNVGKKYKIQHLVGGYLSLRERMVNALKFEKNTTEDFWALKDVSFNVQPGESIGIIGRNGAGQSTLLKILSKITPPTTGKIVTRGRIASLLEVGTGFHPELTGRENIFFNGSLLGMKRIEITAKFDEIVDFSGVEKFLDTPLKHYSSGMQLRLAFAVAAFLEPEILIIDEVLAVGDAEFQRRCLGKMEDVSRSGRTIIFVSHDLNVISVLCKTTILLEKGLNKAIGETNKLIALYIAGTKKPEMHNFLLRHSENQSGSFKIRFTSIVISIQEVTLGKSLQINLGLNNEGVPVGTELYFAITIFSDLGVKLTTLDNLYSGQTIKAQKGEFKVTCFVQAFDLLPGRFSIDLWCADHFSTFHNIQGALTFEAPELDIYQTGKIHKKSLHGLFIPKNTWSV